jgi:hypothetical protein
VSESAAATGRTLDARTAILIDDDAERTAKIDASTSRGKRDCKRIGVGDGGGTTGRCFPPTPGAPWDCNQQARFNAPEPVLGSVAARVQEKPYSAPAVDREFRREKRLPCRGF